MEREKWSQLPMIREEVGKPSQKVAHLMLDVFAEKFVRRRKPLSPEEKK